MAATSEIWQRKQTIGLEYDLCNYGPFIDKNNKITFVTNYKSKYKDYCGIYQYDEKEDKFVLIQKYPEDKRPSITISYCYNPNTNQIFIKDLSASDSLIIHDMNSQKWSKLDRIMKGVGFITACVFVRNNKVHLFAEANSSQHIVYDPTINL